MMICPQAQASVYANNKQTRSWRFLSTEQQNPIHQKHFKSIKIDLSLSLSYLSCHFAANRPPTAMIVEMITRTDRTLNPAKNSAAIDFRLPALLDNTICARNMSSAIPPSTFSSQRLAREGL